ncbi:serine/threonine-protein kinase fray2-like [Clytia hemisphaerica]|uniref:serine/threonine-protein kinase fray2-like n=1 Tax=Clytia hemisphaerica TaxID=252671 RepID=UPI0034D575A1|eukprot:TCONS_00050198-protein
MGSYSSDEDSSRSSRKSKKHRRRSRSRSRSRSSSYDRKHKKHSRKRSRDRSRDRSYDRRRGRSRDRSYDRSRGRSRSRDRSKSYDRSRDRSRDKSRDRSRSRGRASKGSNQLDLKEKIRLLTTSDTALTVKQPKDELIANKPSADDIRKIEEDGFVQESFYKSLSGATTQPTAGKGKKKKKKNKQNQQSNANKASDMYQSMDMSAFQQKEALLLKQDTSHEPLFGALFSETPEVRKERWIEKLQSMRKRIAQ